MRLLIVEDHKDMAETLVDELGYKYAVDVSVTGKDAVYQATINAYDLIVLDLNLPDISGHQVCKALRSAGIKAPVLILTGMDDVDSKVTALDAGADDYLTKPFSFAELSARIRALLRRNAESLAPEIIVVDDLVLNTVSRTVKRGEQEITLRRKEYDLLEYLMRNQGKVVSRSMILDHVWDSDTEVYTNSIDVHIKHLRDKIDRHHPIKLIKTAHGVGYKLEA